MSKKVLARDVRVVLNEGADEFTGLMDCSLNLTTAFATSQTKADKQPVDEPLRVDWEVSVSGEVDSSDSSTGTLLLVQGLSTGMIQSGRVHLRFIIGELASYDGMAIVSGFNEGMPVEGRVSYSATFKGVGNLMKKVETSTVNEE